MSSRNRVLLVGALLAALAFLTGCNQAADNGRSAYLPLYGDGAKDTTPVLARVGDIKITDRDVDLFLDELPKGQRSRYNGPDGRRLALKHMVDKAVLALGAIDRELYRDPDVARQLIALRRNTLEDAMTNYGLLRGVQPSEEELKEFFKENRDKYRQLGTVRARDVITKTREAAQQAYDRLQRGGPKDGWPYVVHDFCVNEQVKERDGELGWFNRGGFVPYVRDAELFTTRAYDLPDGLNPPVKIGDRWHVIEILSRQPERPKTFAEARDQVLKDMLPGYQDAIIKDYLLKARKDYGVELYGEYAPGKGLSVDEIFARAMALTDPQEKLDLFTLIHTDYPESDRADDALFMAAQVSLEQWLDTRIAGRYLKMLVDEYPQSELVDDARYLLENLNNPEVLSRLRGGGSVKEQ